mmetsp:Transcript_31470/g.72409  ORF Transcript_31470/g.72409 Transcript_31470/m.72409 type:complete len:141 (+) Transcript_31470:220-642(+)
MCTRRFRVVIPAHVQAGNVIRIRCPDGTEGNVKVPQGLGAGDSFLLEMPALANHHYYPEPTKTTPQQQHQDSTGGSFESSITSTTISMPPSSLPQSLSASHKSIRISSALSVFGAGLLIGTSILSGFLVGILFATDGTEA